MFFVLFLFLVCSSNTFSCCKSLPDWREYKVSVPKDSVETNVLDSSMKLLGDFYVMLSKNKVDEELVKKDERLLQETLSVFRHSKKFDPYMGDRLENATELLKEIKQIGQK